MAGHGKKGHIYPTIFPDNRRHNLPRLRQWNPHCQCHYHTLEYPNRRATSDKTNGLSIFSCMYFRTSIIKLSSNWFLLQIYVTIHGAEIPLQNCELIRHICKEKKGCLPGISYIPSGKKCPFSYFTYTSFTAKMPSHPHTHHPHPACTSSPELLPSRTRRTHPACPVSLPARDS